MKKTLVVTYTPREGSNTKELIDHFISINKEKTEFSILDLTKEVPDLLLEKNLGLIFKDNYTEESLSDSEQQVLEKNNKMVSQVLEADYIVIGFPMYNFSLPATVKAWVDAIIQTGKTFMLGEEGYVGLCRGKQALTIMTTGSDFGVPPLDSMNYATPLIKTDLEFIGIPSKHISAFGLQQYGDRLSEILEKAKKEITAVSDQWY
ncbi:FMN-dependent NADH-azoreductase [Aquimarina hainanensis]|uniref:FMN dependent NADH:quinone oxidoreductase n=1 Tax=Aquimarina hainanensis TaxID=1578017 RepID=A0ABW5N946_9FLAO|nr:NAD(P)H-dependent oxidoreductase [Aquimarina sp. TRL1]QKX03665.1 hypothetical protein HN014_01620 [Aquimarina sp. TRL1]